MLLPHGGIAAPTRVLAEHIDLKDGGNRAAWLMRP